MMAALRKMKMEKKMVEKDVEEVEKEGNLLKTTLAVTHYIITGRHPVS